MGAELSHLSHDAVREALVARRRAEVEARRRAEVEAREAEARQAEARRRALLEAAGLRGRHDKAAIDGWVECLLAYAGQRRVLHTPALLRCCRVSRRWRDAVHCALPTLRTLDFHGYTQHVTGPDVLAVLGRVAGGNVAAVDLSRCRRLGAEDVEQILACVAAICPGVTEINVKGCSEGAQLRALAVCASALCDVASPRALFEFIAALPKGGSLRCPLEQLQALMSPSLRLDLVPGRHALRDAARRHGSAVEVAVLLSLSFPTAQGEHRTFDHNEKDNHGRRAVHAAAERGDGVMLGVLISAGAFLNEEGTFGDTPLLLACREEHLELAKMLVGKGADVSAANRQGNTPLLLTCKAGNLELAQVLLDKGADASAADKQGDTPLLLTCKAGNLELAQVLLDKGADASAANQQGDSPLLGAVAAGNADLCQELVARGANVEASREDGANVLALAILSQKEACIKFALTQGPSRLEGQDTLDVCTFLQRLAQAFRDPSQIGAWIRCGAAPNALLGEIRALLLSADVGAAVKGQLEDVQAFLNHHEDLLGNRSRWSVPQAEQLVAQLASQEPDTIFAPVESDTLDAIIEWKNKPQVRRRCRRTHKADGSNSFSDHGVPARHLLGPCAAFSPDGSRLLYGAGKTVVVRNLQTGLVVLQLSFPARVRCVQFSPSGDIIAAGCESVTQIIDVATAEVVRQIEHETAGDNSSGGLYAGGGGITCVAFSPDGSLIATGDANIFSEKCNFQGFIRLYAAGTGAPFGDLLDVTNNDEIHSFIWSIEFSVDGSNIAVAFSVCAYEDRLLVSAGVMIFSNQGSAGFVRKKTLKEHSMVDDTGDYSTVSVSWSPDGKRLVSGSHDKTVTIWDPTTGEKLFQLKGHTDRVNSVCFSPDGTRIISGGDDKALITWDAASGEQLSSLSCDSQKFLSVRFHPSGDIIAAGCAGEELPSRWMPCYVQLIDMATAEVKRPLGTALDLLQEWGHRFSVRNVEFADKDTIVSEDINGETMVWSLMTAREKTEALPGFTFSLSKHGALEQQAGCYMCKAEGEHLLIHLIEDGGTAGGADEADKAATAPVAFFRAPSPILALDCSGADIALGCQSGEVLLLRAAVLVT